MLSVYCRVLVKLIFFVAITFVVLFFIVYGYRYEKEVGFIQKNVYFTLEFWSNQNLIKMDNEYYSTEVGRLDLYNFEQGCYDLEYYGTNYTVCLENEQSFNDVFIRSASVEILGKTLKNNECNNVQFLTHEPYSIAGQKFSEKIVSAFRYKNIHFVKLNKNLFSCNNNFSICKNIAKLKGEIVCGNENGLIFHDKEFRFLKIY